jgi:hypothetical protein
VSRFALRCKAEELASWKSMAAASGMSLAALIRSKLDGPAKVADRAAEPVPGADEMTPKLCKMCLRFGIQPGCSRCKELLEPPKCTRCQVYGAVPDCPQCKLAVHR